MPRHTVIDLMPLLAILDDVYGAPKALDSDTRNKLWVRAMEPFPLEIVRAAIGEVVLDHDGFFPKPAMVRKIAWRMMREREVRVAPDLETCATCGATFTEHTVVRRHLLREKMAGGTLPADTPLQLVRTVMRHKPDHRCTYLNAAHGFPDTLDDAEREALYAG